MFEICCFIFHISIQTNCIESTCGYMWLVANVLDSIDLECSFLSARKRLSLNLTNTNDKKCFI